jgi:hypothetical protein
MLKMLAREKPKAPIEYINFCTPQSRRQTDLGGNKFIAQTYGRRLADDDAMVERRHRHTAEKMKPAPKRVKVQPVQDIDRPGPLRTRMARP